MPEVKVNDDGRVILTEVRLLLAATSVILTEILKEDETSSTKLKVLVLEMITEARTKVIKKTRLDNRIKLRPNFLTIFIFYNHPLIKYIKITNI